MNRINTSDKAYMRARNVLRKKIEGYVSEKTVKAYLSFSVGRVQILVYNYYFIDSLFSYIASIGKLPVSIPFLLTDDEEFEAFKIFIKARNIPIPDSIADDERLNTFAKMYNGSVDYALCLKNAYDFYEKQGLL